MTADELDLDERLDALFATTPDGFVAAREALVRELKQAGRRDDATTVHGLRRPTVAVWSINQMARARPDQLAALVDAGAELDSLQHGGADARDDLRAATRRRRALLDELTEDAASRADRPDTVSDEHRRDARRRVARPVAAGRPPRWAPHRRALTGRPVPRRRR